MLEILRLPVDHPARHNMALGPLPHGESEPKVSESDFPVNLVSELDSQRLREILDNFSIFHKDVSRFESVPIPSGSDSFLGHAHSPAQVREVQYYRIHRRAAPCGQSGRADPDGHIFHKDEKLLVALAEGAYHSWWTTGIHDRG